MFPVGGKSDEMTVRKTSIFGEMYLLSDTAVCAFSEAAFGAPRPLVSSPDRIFRARRKVVWARDYKTPPPILILHINQPAYFMERNME